MSAAGEDRRASILQASAELFAEVGFAATTVRGIAVACGLSSGSLFHHYPTKRELLVDVVAEGTHRAHALVEAGLAAADGPAERLHALVLCHLTSLHGDARPFAVVATNEFGVLDDAERKRVVASRDAYEQLWSEVLGEAAAAGLVPSDPLLRLFLLGATNATFAWFDPTAGVSLEELTDRFLAMVSVPTSTLETP